MSKYKEIRTVYKNTRSLVKAIESVTGKRPTVSREPQSLYGYTGDKRAEKAHVIIPRITVNNFSGGSSNDIGFVKENGTYKSIVSEFDERQAGSIGLLKKIKQEYSLAETKRLARTRGYSSGKPERKEDGTITIKLRLN